MLENVFAGSKIDQEINHLPDSKQEIMSRCPPYRIDHIENLSERTNHHSRQTTEMQQMTGRTTGWQIFSQKKTIFEVCANLDKQVNMKSRCMFIW